MRVGGGKQRAREEFHQFINWINDFLREMQAVAQEWIPGIDRFGAAQVIGKAMNSKGFRAFRLLRWVNSGTRFEPQDSKLD